MKGIEISVSIYSDEEMKLKELDLPIKERHELWEKRTFWQVDYAMPSNLNPKYTFFYVGGDSFITPILYKDFVKLINKTNEIN